MKPLSRQAYQDLQRDVRNIHAPGTRGDLVWATDHLTVPFKDDSVRAIIPLAGANVGNWHMTMAPGGTGMDRKETAYVSRILSILPGVHAQSEREA